MSQLGSPPKRSASQQQSPAGERQDFKWFNLRTLKFIGKSAAEAGSRLRAETKLMNPARCSWVMSSMLAQKCCTNSASGSTSSYSQTWSQ